MILGELEKVYGGICKVTWANDPDPDYTLYSGMLGMMPMSFWNAEVVRMTHEEDCILVQITME